MTIDRIARAMALDDRHITDEVRIEIAKGLLALRRKGDIDALYIDGGRIQVRRKPGMLLAPLTWHRAARMVYRGA